MGEFVSSGGEGYGIVGSDLEKCNNDDLVGAKFTMNGCKFFPSKFSDGEYVLVDVSIGDHHFAWETSGAAVVDDCRENGKMGNFPCEVTLEAIPTDKGNPFLKLRSPK